MLDVYGKTAYLVRCEQNLKVIVHSTIHDFSTGVESNGDLCSGTAHVDNEMDFNAPQALGK